MGGHHKKNLRSEKAKVKLKGAKLPKGLNVTKTDFKVRKIAIREQLKDSVINESGQRQLNLKETLSRLKHHSLKFRSDALRNVRDSVKTGTANHLIGHLTELLQGIAAGALDIEPDARRESFKTLDAVLENLQPQAVTPFFHILATYLRCAMTHVLPAIQEDSLLMLDVLLHRLPPQLLAERSAHTIIGNFIGMISRARHDNERSNRTLTLQLGHGKQTTIKWRTKVLQRLYQILSTLVQHNNSKGSSKPARVVMFDAQTPQYYGVLRPKQLSTNESCELFGLSTEDKVEGPDTQLRTYVEQLMPLLIDNWLEVRPQPVQSTSTTITQRQRALLTGEAATSLHVLLEIMMQLWTLVNQHEAATNTLELSSWTRTTFAASFVRNFLDADYFPYEQMVPPAAKTTKRTKKADTSVDPFCVLQNLSLVQLMSHFNPQPATSQLTATYERLLSYLQQRLQDLNNLGPEQQLRLVAALRALLHDNGAALLKVQPEATSALLRTTMEAYVQQRYTTREGVATRLLHTLCLIVQHADLFAAYGGDEQFAIFLGYLPQLLLKPTVSESTLCAMSTLCRQLNRVFMMALVENANAIVAHIEQLQMTGAGQGADATNTDKDDAFESKKRVLNLFYYARDCNGNQSKEKLNECLQQLEASSVDERITSYFRCMLTYP
ncbi:testis-expressed protein 10 homolog [Scaptodrosophila lebanonensis]|uniref:Testis-expressed protein 10 homolog n=1 Tax=Drosophila lebanonensis TaxID=7225 RepID=A0A6J2TSG5_DROLE|nr:testis-expressed protein 10 homolog [Scaptodrosophila lebanonensis]